jgi:hypothetical protein
VGEHGGCGRREDAQEGERGGAEMGLPRSVGVVLEEAARWPLEASVGSHQGGGPGVSLRHGCAVQPCGELLRRSGEGVRVQRSGGLASMAVFPSQIEIWASGRSSCLRGRGLLGKPVARCSGSCCRARGAIDFRPGGC